MESFEMLLKRVNTLSILDALEISGFSRMNFIGISKDILIEGILNKGLQLQNEIRIDLLNII